LRLFICYITKLSGISDRVASSGRVIGECELEITWEEAILARTGCRPYVANIDPKGLTKTAKALSRIAGLRVDI
jgi:hypothetical protein